MSRTFLKLAGFAAVMAAPTAMAQYRFETPQIESSYANSTNMSRCGFDQLPSDRARIQSRLDWAERCKIVKVGKKFTHWLDSDDNWHPLDLPKYPVFVHNVDGTPVWIPNEGSCDIPSDVIFYQICAAGCFAPTQKVLFADGYKEILEAKAEKAASLMTVAPDSTLASVALEASPVQYYVESEREALEDLATIQTAGGGKLEVTLNHPLVTADGHVRAASTFKVGDSLVTETGTLDPIVSVTVAPYFGKVYNVAPESFDATRNLIVAEGYLNGSHKFQTSEILDLDGYSLRRPDVPASLFE